jgi:hypothetical protein
MVLSPHACNELKLLQMIFFLATNVSLSWFYVRQYIPFFQEDITGFPPNPTTAIYGYRQ